MGFFMPATIFERSILKFARSVPADPPEAAGMPARSLHKQSPSLGAVRVGYLPRITMLSKTMNEILHTARNSPLSTTAGVLALGLSVLYLFQSRRSRRTSKLAPERERVLILGATSGVGRTLAHKYASRGAFVCVLGRRQLKLDEVLQECRECSERAGFQDRVVGVRGDCGNSQDMVRLREKLHKGRQ